MIARVDGAEVVVAEPEAGHHAGAEVLDDDVGLGGQLEDPLATLGILEVGTRRCACCG